MSFACQAAAVHGAKGDTAAVSPVTYRKPPNPDFVTRKQSKEAVQVLEIKGMPEEQLAPYRPRQRTSWHLTAKPDHHVFIEDGVGFSSAITK